MVNDQFQILKKDKLLPRTMRHTLHFIKLVIKILSSKHSLKNNINIHCNKTKHNLRSHYQIPNFHTNYSKFSFSTISIQFLNKFLYDLMSKNNNKQLLIEIKKNILYYFNKITNFIT